jgi:hypothetical protein
MTIRRMTVRKIIQHNNNEQKDSQKIGLKEDTWQNDIRMNDPANDNQQSTSKKNELSECHLSE